MSPGRPPAVARRSWSRLARHPLTAWVVPLAAPPAVAALLIPGRGHLNTADDALVLVVVTVAVASWGNRRAAALCALMAALSFDFFLTVPYQSLRISGGSDVTTEILFVVTGLLVGELAARGQRHRRAAVEGRYELGRIHEMAERIAGGEEPDFVLMAVAAELRELLSLQDCRFVSEPPSEKGARINPDGTVRLNPLQWPTASAGLPTRQVELPVRGGGGTMGTFILTPTPALPISQERCIVAVALADQLGSILSSTRYGHNGHNGDGGDGDDRDGDDGQNNQTN
jgi:K+-sensing histidine kinase KdpD